MIRRIFLSVVLTVCCAAASQAQNIGAFKQKLAETETTVSGTAAVTVNEHGDAAEAVAAAAVSSRQYRVRGYRVCIFFDNGPSARYGATKARNLFLEKYGDISSDMRYENPYFKVTVGDCLTEEEAIILKGRILSDFPKAYVKQEEININEL